MYCDFFGLRCRPFEDRADTRFFYATADADEALAAMEYESHFGKGASLILGEAGTGKTLLVRTLLQRLHTTDHVVVLTWMSDGPTDLTRETCKGFGVSVPSSGQAGRVVPRLRRHLLRTHQGDHRSILIVDQVENLTIDNVAQLSTLLNIQHNGQKLLSVILVGQPHFQEKLAGSEFAGVRQHLYGERTLKALAMPDTRAYIAHRLRIAGAGDTNLFDREAIARIHEASDGVPRLINHMCDAALLAAYGARHSTVGETIAAEVAGQQKTKERTVAAEHVGLGSATEVASGWQGRQETGVAVERRDRAPNSSSRPAPAAEPIAASPDWNEHLSGDARAEAGSGGADAAREAIDATDGFSVSEQALARLERAVARAERMTATSDAAAARCAAVEKHLATMMSGADRLNATLTESAHRAVQSLDSVQARVNRIFDDADARLSKIDQRVTQAADTSAETEEQADRLDRACETGRQVEARLANFAGQLADKADDVQGHITGLMDGMTANDEARGKLAALIDQAGRVTAETDERIQTLRQKLQEGQTDARRLSERLTGELVEGCVSALEEKARDHERSVEDSVETARETLEGLVDACRQRLKDELAENARSTLDAAETARNNLDALTERATSTTHDADVQLAQLRTTVEQVGREAAEVTGKLVESAVARCRQQVTKYVADQVHSHEEAIEASAAASRKKMAEAAESFDQRVIGLEERVATARRVADEAARVCDQSVTARIGQANQGIHTLGRQIERMEKQRGDVEQTLCALDAKLDGSITRVEELDALMKDRVPAVGELAARAEKAGTQLSTTVSHAETLVHDVKEASGQVVTLQQTTSTTLVQLGGACERLGAVRDELRESEQTIGRLGAVRHDVERMIGDLDKALSSARPIEEIAERILPEASRQTRHLESRIAAATGLSEQLDTTVHAGQAVIDQVDAVGELAGRLTEVQSAGDTTVSQLEQILASAQPVLQAVRQAVSEATEQERRIESTRASVTGVLDDLTLATADGRGLAEGIADDIRKAIEVSDTTAEHLVRMQATREAGTRIVQELADLIGSASDIHKSLQGVVAHTDEKLGRLESHGAAATRTLGELSTSTLKGEAVAKQLSAATANVQQVGAETVARIDRGIRDVWDLNSRTDVNLKALTTQSTQAVEVTRKLTGVLGPAGETLADLTRRTDDARTATSSMEKHIDSAVRLADRIQSLSTLLETVQHAEASVKETAVAARSTCDRLAGATEEAATRCDSLNDVGARTQTLIDTHERVTQNAESVVARLTTQLAAGEKAAEVAQPLLEDFIAQSRDVDRHLREAKQEALRMEESVKQGTQRPAELVAKAQQQAAELERVCEAVRKIFSGLSKTSLEARNDTNAFHKVRGQAQEKFAEVLAEAGRATATLEEWVQEAVRAQTRLARTLDDTPSIHETHPPGAARGMPHGGPRDRRMGSPGATGELEVLRAPKVSSTSESKPPGKTTSRSATIARLIEDAKKASVVESA